MPKAKLLIYVQVEGPQVDGTTDDRVQALFRETLAQYFKNIKVSINSFTLQ